MDENNERNTDKIVSVKIEKEMRQSFIDYAMSVITSRALPDVRTPAGAGCTCMAKRDAVGEAYVVAACNLEDAQAVGYTLGDVV